MENIKLKAIVEKIEKLNEEKENITQQISEIYSEAKSEGFDTKILKKVIALRKLALQERLELESMVETYKKALGMNNK